MSLCQLLLRIHTAGWKAYLRGHRRSVSCNHQAALRTPHCQLCRPVSSLAYQLMRPLAYVTMSHVVLPLRCCRVKSSLAWIKSHASIRDNGDNIGMPKKPVSIVLTLVALAIAVFDEARKVWQMPEMVTALCVAVSLAFSTSCYFVSWFCIEWQMQEASVKDF
jgi:hypothetical protein